MSLAIDTERLRADEIAALNTEFVGQSPEAILTRVVTDIYKGRIGIVSSFGAESVVLLHLVAQIDPSVPVVFLNTGKLFGETLRYRDRLQAVLGLTDIRSVAPHPEDLRAQDKDGALWSKDMDACCHIRKVLPQERAIAGFDALITGRKRFQTNARQAMDIVEDDDGRRVKVNPLADWGLDDLRAYIERYDLPRHPLVKDGYLSIGCMPCTARVEAGADYRSGRWAGSDKDECGIHMNRDGDGI